MGWIKRHPKGLGIALLSLFLVSWVIQTWFGYWEYVADAYEHGSIPAYEEYFNIWMRATFENWQSEFLQLLTFVVLTANLIYRGSHESKDGQDRMEAKIDALDRNVNRLRVQVWGDQK